MHDLENTQCPQALYEAADWLVRLDDDDVTAPDIEAHRRWLCAAPANAAAWRQAESLSRLFDTIPAALGNATLRNTDIDPQRRKLLGTAAAIAIAAPMAWWGLDGRGMLSVDTHVSTIAGERRKLRLPDGGILHLNTDTRIEIAYDNRQRLLRLLQGEVMVETARDSQLPPRPWRLQTHDGEACPIGTRFSVRLMPDATHLAVAEGQVDAIPANRPFKYRVRAGQQVRFNAKDILDRSALSESDFDWIHGRLNAHAMPLGELVAELARHRRGWLDCDPTIAHLPVSGVFQLADIDAALALLTETFPIRLRYRSRWWVSLLPAATA